MRERERKCIFLNIERKSNRERAREREFVCVQQKMKMSEEKKGRAACLPASLPASVPLCMPLVLVMIKSYIDENERDEPIKTKSKNL